MSGGHFNHSQYNLLYLAEEIEELIKSNTDTSDDGYGNMIGRFYEPETIERFKEAVALLKKAKIYVQRIDYLVSGDDGEATFHDRLVEELPEPQPNKKCYVDKVALGEVYDDCVLDLLNKWDCDHALKHDINDKKNCKYWR